MSAEAVLCGSQVEMLPSGSAKYAAQPVGEGCCAVGFTNLLRSAQVAAKVHHQRHLTVSESVREFAPNMLNFAEEVMLLMLEDENGRFAHVPELCMRCVLGGAVLMELAMKDRIDTDLEKLVVINPKPTGDDLLDPTLKHIVESEEDRDARYWVEFSAREADNIRRTALDRLITKGILRREDDRFLWVFRSRRYPMIDGKAEREAKLRIVGILFSDEVPDPRDVVMISLVDACGLFKHILSEREHKRARPRIRQVRKMDLIGQAVTNAVREIEASLALAMHPPF